MTDLTFPETGPTVETHPLQPFIPENARLLMLGSFPPPRKRWSMDFFYPNYLNDMWRIFGLIVQHNPAAYLDPVAKTFCRESIERMLTERHIALYDAAIRVNRLDGNASDARLEILERTPLADLLEQMPHCRAIASTGGRSAETIAEIIGCKTLPGIGEWMETDFARRRLRFYRMPSSSRAYPMKLEAKAAFYRDMLADLGLIP